MKELLEQRHKEFEEKFAWHLKPRHTDEQWEAYKSFADQTVRLVLEKVREELERQYQPFMEEFKCGGCGACEACRLQNDVETRGFNFAIDKTRSLLTSAIEELGGRNP